MASKLVKTILIGFLMWLYFIEEYFWLMFESKIVDRLWNIVLSWSIPSIFREPVCALSRIDTAVQYWPTDRFVLSYDLQDLRSYTQ